MTNYALADGSSISVGNTSLFAATVPASAVATVTGLNGGSVAVPEPSALASCSRFAPCRRRGFYVEKAPRRDGIMEGQCDLRLLRQWPGRIPLARARSDGQCQRTTGKLPVAF